MSTPRSLPQHARVVVVGGGIIGTSTAYHLALMGWKDIVLLERHQLTAGTTWHAAGLMVAFGSTSETSTNLRKYTRDLYSRLEAETGQATGFMPIGFIEVASDKDRLEEYRRVSAFNRYCGIDVHELSPREVEALFPLARVDDIEAGFYVKEDGRVNPVDVTMALGKGAKLRGVKIFEGVPATGVLQKWRHQDRFRRELHRHVGARVRRDFGRQPVEPGG
jgi:glycine/D-amino acid oxidase-like deaminating enzyme